MQIKEHHSLERLRNALEKTPLYKRIVQRLKVNWIGLNFIPPLLLGIQEKKQQIEEQQEWAEIEKNAKFHLQEGTPTKIPWDFRAATRAIYEMELSG